MALQLSACHRVPPLYRHIDWCLSGLEICSSGSASTPGTSHPCASYVRLLFPPAYFILVEDEDSGYRVGIFTRLGEGSCSSSFGRLLKIRKS